MLEEGLGDGLDDGLCHGVAKQVVAAAVAAGELKAVLQALEACALTGREFAWACCPALLDEDVSGVFVDVAGGYGAAAM